MSRCWVEFRERVVPNTWNPRLVGTKLRPRRKPRCFGSVPTIRCVSSKQGLKCLRQNPRNKRWFSPSPARRTCERTSPSRGPGSARVIRKVIDPRAQMNLTRSMNAHDSICPEECIGPVMPGMKVPKEYEVHILDHMRCNCSACMNFACQWRRALKDEFRECVKDPLAPKRKPKRCMPLVERQRPCEKARHNARPDKPSTCRRSPRVSWWYGNYSPSSESDEYFPQPEPLAVEQRHIDNLNSLRHSQHAAESIADGFEDVAMDGTTVPSRLTYRATRDVLPCRDNEAGCVSRDVASFNRLQSTRRNHLAQGILNIEEVPVESEIYDLDIPNTPRLGNRHLRTKYTNPPDENWGKDIIYENKDDSQNFLDDRDEFKHLSEVEKYPSPRSRNLISDKSANKYSPYRQNPRISRTRSQGAMYDDKVNRFYDTATGRNQHRSQFSLRSEGQFGRGHHHVNHNAEYHHRLSYPDSQITKFAQSKHSNLRDHYQPYNKTHSVRYLSDVNPRVNANSARYGRLSEPFPFPNESLDSRNRGHRYNVRQPDSNLDHQHRYKPPHHQRSSQLHDGSPWNFSHHASQSSLEMPRQLPQKSREYPVYTEINPDIFPPQKSREYPVNTEIHPDIFPPQKSREYPVYTEIHPDIFPPQKNREYPVYKKIHPDIFPPQKNREYPVYKEIHPDIFPPQKSREYPVYTEIHPETFPNKNIYNRSVDKGAKDTQASSKGNITRRKINFHSEKIKELESDSSKVSVTSARCRLPSKLCKRWTSLSPSKIDICPPKSRSVAARELNDNDNKSIGEYPPNEHSQRELLGATDKIEDCKHRPLTSSCSRRKQKLPNADKSALTDDSSEEGENNNGKRQRIYSMSPLDSTRLKTPGRSRRSRSRSRRRTEDNQIKVMKSAGQVLDTTQSNAAYSTNSQTRQTADRNAFGPSERVMREPRPKSRPEWLNKHMSLMTECSQVQQNNAKSRMTRIVQKTNALSRSTDHMKADFDQLHERLDRVKDLQQSYFHRAEEAIQKMKDRNRACSKSRLAKDNSQNARESHHRDSTTDFRGSVTDPTSSPRHAKETHRHRTRTKKSRSSSTERGRLYANRENGNTDRQNRAGTRENGNPERQNRTRTRENGNPERQNRSRTREKGNTERQNPARVANSEGGLDISFGDKFPTADIPTDSDSETDSQTDDGNGSWFIDDKRRLIAKKSNSTTKHRHVKKC